MALVDICGSYARSRSAWIAVTDWISSDFLCVWLFSRSTVTFVDYVRCVLIAHLYTPLPTLRFVRWCLHRIVTTPRSFVRSYDSLARSFDYGW